MIPNAPLFPTGLFGQAIAFSGLVLLAFTWRRRSDTEGYRCQAIVALRIIGLATAAIFAQLHTAKLVTGGVEFLAFGALLHRALYSDRRYPLILAALALIAAVCQALVLIGLAKPAAATQMALVVSLLMVAALLLGLGRCNRQVNKFAPV